MEYINTYSLETTPDSEAIQHTGFIMFYTNTFQWKYLLLA